MHIFSTELSVANSYADVESDYTTASKARHYRHEDLVYLGSVESLYKLT